MYETISCINVIALSKVKENEEEIKIVLMIQFDWCKFVCNFVDTVVIKVKKRNLMQHEKTTILAFEV